MANRRRPPTAQPDPALIDSALATLGAEELRELARWAFSELDGQAYARTAERLFQWARTCGWSPAGPSTRTVAEAVSFAQAAARVGHADPDDVDGYLREGQNAFHRRDYPSARKIFGALLPPIGEVEIYLGHYEMLDEVLCVNTSICATQYVVATYMTTSPDERPQAVHSAIFNVGSVGFFWEPLKELERVAIEPLPEFDAFLAGWRELLAGRLEDDPSPGTGEDRWLREVAQRLEGAPGLAEIARTTRRAEDLQAWCECLAEEGDWKAALSAYEEAAETVAEDPYDGRPVAKFLDGAALAAQELARRDLPSRLEKAWRAEPTLRRLRRWLGSASSKSTLKKRARAALDSVPTNAHRQRALLYLLLADFDEAAKLLAAAPGLGCSSAEHPGHLVFPLFEALLGERALPKPLLDPPHNGLEADEFEQATGDREEPTLNTPELESVLEIAAVKSLPRRSRPVLLKAMREAAEKRTAGVTANRRRRHYGHAADLVAACVALDPGRETTEWVSSLRARYSRFSALQREFTARLGPR